jgi:succinate dehydrogenase hydrophobic anchor subunit
MTSKTIALGVLDWIFMAATMLVLLVVAGCPVGWLLRLTDMSLREFQWFALFIVFSSLGLIHAIATSDSAP